MTARIVYWAGVLDFLITIVVAWFVLPEQVPTHFGWSGQADAWSSREVTVLTSGAIGFAVAMALWLLTVQIARSTLQWVNIPHKQWWLDGEDRKREVRIRLSEDVFWLGGMTMVLLASLQQITIGIANDANAALGPSWWVVFGGYVTAMTAYVGFMLVRRYRPEISRA